MSRIALHSVKAGFAIVVMTALFAGCSDDTPLAPGGGPDVQAQFEHPVAIANAVDRPDPQLGACPNLRVPAGSRLVTRTYAEGVQIYRWNGTSWVFVAPEAALFPNASAQGQVGSHYAGPTWESVSGSKVTGAVVDRCTPDAGAVPWLLLAAVSTDGPGLFRGVTRIQRVHTTGGLAPAQPGTVVGEEARVPYTADYFFYRGR
jgi:hypothetical protein